MPKVENLLKEFRYKGGVWSGFSNRVSVNPAGIACIINLVAILGQRQDECAEENRAWYRQSFSDRTQHSIAEAGEEAADHLRPILGGKVRHASTDEAPHKRLGS